MKRAHIIISGRVHAVGFRLTAFNTAEDLGLVGFVRNLPNGAVEIVAEGKEENLQELISWCKRGPAGAAVRKVDVNFGEATGEFENFEIKI